MQQATLQNKEVTLLRCLSERLDAAAAAAPAAAFA
jgi:hypothetical protein